MIEATSPGVYFGYAQVSARRSDNRVDEPPSGALNEEQTEVHPMVMSLGWNPFFKNKELAAVCHYHRSIAFADEVRYLIVPLPYVLRYRRFTSCTALAQTFTGMR